MLVAEYNIGLMTVRLAFLVKYVEQCSVKLGFVDIDASFVFHAMMDVGITMPRLLDVYDQLFKSRVSACLCVCLCLRVCVSTCADSRVWLFVWSITCFWVSRPNPWSSVATIYWDLSPPFTNEWNPNSDFIWSRFSEIFCVKNFAVFDSMKRRSVCACRTRCGSRRATSIICCLSSMTCSMSSPTNRSLCLPTNGRRRSCAVFSGFAISARVSLLWQHNADWLIELWFYVSHSTQNTSFQRRSPSQPLSAECEMSASACNRCVPGFVKRIAFSALTLLVGHQ